MATFLPWNVDRKPLDGVIQNLVRRSQVAVLLLERTKEVVLYLPGNAR